MKAGKAMRDAKGVFPTLVVAVIPETGTDIYTAVKQLVPVIYSDYYFF